MTTFVLVPGACHGGWMFQPLVDRLVDLGHTVHPLTLPGIGERAAELDGTVNLDTHVADVVDRMAAVEDAVLVGHSYGGSVISGVADRIPDRIRALVYVDAFVPEDGDSCWTMTNDEQRRWYVEAAARTGVAVDPMPFFDARATPHPVATLLQRSRLGGAWRSVAAKHYVLATAPGWLPHSPFVGLAERLRADPAWTVHDLPVPHNVLRNGPAELLAVLRPLA